MRGVSLPFGLSDPGDSAGAGHVETVVDSALIRRESHHPRALGRV
jgi:hypothetical protein